MVTPREEQAAFYFEVGLAITQWARVEYDLYELTSRCFDKRSSMDYPAFYEAFFSIDNFRAKLKFADTIIVQALKGKDVGADWPLLHSRIAKASKVRNRLAHYPVLHFQDNPAGRNIALTPRALDALSPGTGRIGKKYPTGALFLRDVVRSRLEFFALMISLSNFAHRVRGLPEQHSKSDEQPRDPPTTERIVSRLRATFSRPQKSSRAKS